jgi:hypothetical protein
MKEKKRRTKAEARNAKPASGLVQPGWTKGTEVRGVAAPDISMFGRSGLKLKSLAT